MTIEKDDSSGAICGGVVKESEYERATEVDVWAYAMSYIMPDKQFKLYATLKNQGKDKEAKKLFDEHAWSVI